MLLRTINEICAVLTRHCCPSVAASVCVSVSDAVMWQLEAELTEEESVADSRSTSPPLSKEADSLLQICSNAPPPPSTPNHTTTGGSGLLLAWQPYRALFESPVGANANLRK